MNYKFVAYALLILGLCAQLSIQQGYSAPARSSLLALPQPFAMVKDIGTTAYPGSSLSTGGAQYFRGATIAGSTAFFQAYTPDAGYEFWRSDSTQAGTFMLKDICPGAEDTFGTEFAALGTLMLFVADDCATGKELWASDGTSAGTRRVKDIYAGAYSSSPENMVVVGGLLFFNAYNGSQTLVWKSDGTEAGTSSIGISGTPLARLGNTLIYITYEASVCKLKSLNITNNAITDIATICPSNTGFGDPEIAAGPTLLYFTASTSATGVEVWRSDGTAAGTFLLKDIRPGSEGSQPRSFAVNPQNELFFSANDGSNGQELWISNGSTPSTQLLNNINPSGSSDPSELKLWNGNLYFRAYDGTQVELWRTNGFASNTAILRDLTPAGVSSYPNFLTVTSAGLFFSATDASHSRALFKTDGTSAGTVFIKDFSGTGRELSMLAAFGAGVIFLGNDGEHGGEPWFSDGTEAGTMMLKDIVGAETISSRPFSPFNLQGKLLYFAYNPDSFASGDLYALYSSDGSADNTLPIKSFSTFSLGSSGEKPALFNTAVYFAVSTSTGANGTELWRSDGTTAGTSMLVDIYPGLNSSSPTWLTPSGQILFFSAINANNGKELWKTGGTAETTELIKDIAPGMNGSYPEFLVSDGAGGIYFAANDGTSGTELWHSDGTAANTRMVIDIRPGSNSSYPENLTIAGTNLFFTADNGIHGRELWVTNGTAEGTRHVRDINPGTSGSSFEPYRQPFAVMGNQIFFGVGTDLFGYELWISDGTETGTAIVKDVYPGSGTSNIKNLTVFNGSLYFAATGDDNKRTLWKSDGTTANTQRVLSGAAAPINPQSLNVMDDRLYFSASSEAAGQELWISDGTAAGTALFQDLNTGPINSNPNPFMNAGEQFYLAAYKPGAGRELWSAAVQLPPPPPANPRIFVPLVQR